MTTRGGPSQSVGTGGSSAAAPMGVTAKPGTGQPRSAQPTVGTRRLRRRNLGRVKRAGSAYGFVTPFLIAFVLFNLVPLFYAIYSSLFREDFFGTTRFVGLSNYRQVFSSSDFWHGVLRMIEFGAVQVPVMLVLALFFAVLFDLSLVGRAGLVYKVLYFAPYAIPGVISAIMWSYLYTPTLSPITTMLNHAGVQFDILGSGWVMFALGNMVTWQYVGVNMVILYTVLQGIPTELTDSAAVDGASLWQLVRYVRVPMVRGGLVLTAALSIIGTLQLFTEPYILSGFSNAIGSSFAPNVLIYTEAFQESNLNYAAALSVVIGGITVVALAVFFAVSGRGRRTDVAQ